MENSQNRIIKFRAWDKNWKKWEDGSICFPVDRMSERAGMSGFILTQYTGLKDKNGKEIYEGDIIKWVDTTGRLPNINLFIEWYKFHYRLSKKELDISMINYSISDTENLEIIGNIYDNPELLEEKLSKLPSLTELIKE